MNVGAAILAEIKDEARFYASMYRKNKGIFWRGAGKGGKGIGMGAIGKGVYVTWEKGMAKAFAALHGQSGKVEAYKLKKGLKMLDQQSATMGDIKKKMGFEPWEWTDNPMYANFITHEVKGLGFDGVVSDKVAEGIVVFDPKDMEKVKA